jgi:putative acetyltransferase
MTALEFRIDHLEGDAIRALVSRHLRGMHESSPPQSVHAFDLSGLRHPSVTFWSVWSDDTLAGMGALKELGGARGEIKSMRVADGFVGKGVGRAMLAHILADARRRGMTSLWLETGSAPAFVPAISLYERAGFVRCGPFDDYIADPFSIFMTKSLA